MNILLFPPIVFILSLCFIYLLFKLITPAPSKNSPSQPATGKFKPYGCGEEVSGEKAVPDYNQFFPFAVFFTLLHVAGLVIATWAFNPFAAGIGPIIAYIVAVLIILAVLFTE